MNKTVGGFLLGAVAASGVAALLFFVFARTPTIVSEKKPASTAAVAPAAMTSTGGAKVESIDVLVERLRKRLESNPGDVDGWVLLGRSYHYLQRWDDAAAAFARARALGYQGEAPAAAGDDGGAQAMFAGVERAAQESAQRLQAEPAATAGVHVHVGVDAATARTLPAGTPVFIFARAAEGGGPPLAVVRRQLGDLPLDVELDDSQAMMPAFTLFRAHTIVVGARISRSGSPIARPGDIEALSAPLADWRGGRVQLNLAQQQQTGGERRP